MSFLLEMHGIQKNFGTVKALRGADFNVKTGEIVGLLGDNGAGKSTLIKIISGLYGADSGSFLFKGEPVDFRRYSVARARKMGVETVYQDRALGVQQPLWRNMFMGRHLKNRFGLIDAAAEKKAARHLLADLGLGGDRLTPDTPAGVLSGGERQGIAIGRAMYFDAELVILDEPTTALAVNEVDKVLSFIQAVKEKGKSVIFITHTIDHVWQAADRFFILSHGATSCVLERTAVSFDELLSAVRRGS
ncbi:MAG: ATP-binding cassette domain-containing protein [Treponema sp.]